MIRLLVLYNSETTETYSLSLHDALPISPRRGHAQLHQQHGRHGERHGAPEGGLPQRERGALARAELLVRRSEEHTSELQSPYELVCRLLLEKKKTLKRK